MVKSQVIKAVGGEEKNRGEETMSRRRKTSRRKESDLKELFVIILGFAGVAFGLLLLITPANYPIGNIPITYNPLIGIIMIALGLFLLLQEVIRHG